MSFGFPDRNIDNYSSLEKSIEKAHTSHRLLFAAASNSGANLERAYPARQEEVICVHSTNSNGNRSDFSPTAMHGHNFATIGEAVGSAWPPSLTEEGAGDVYKSGTSFATPIAASIGAFLLQFARLHFTAEKAQELKKSSRMKAVLEAIAKKNLRDGYEYIELSLYGDNFFGKEDLVGSLLLDAMKHSS
jgi:subtilisin family serine protease